MTETHVPEGRDRRPYGTKYATGQQLLETLQAQPPGNVLRAPDVKRLFGMPTGRDNSEYRRAVDTIADDVHVGVFDDEPGRPGWIQARRVVCPTCSGEGRQMSYAPVEGDPEYDDCSSCQGEGMVANP